MFEKIKCTYIFFIIVLVVLPTYTVFAEESPELCNSDGYTISAINGIFTDEEGARTNQRFLKIVLEEAYGDTYNGEKIDYQYLLNPSHLAGLGDIIKSIEQGLLDSETVEDYDLYEMLRDASEKVATRKLLLVAHSQGNFYANSFYDVVADKEGGVPAESIAVYSVATPSGRVAGGGKWMTSETDKAIAGLLGRTLSRNIMPPNTSIKLQEGDDFLGHDFSGIYLKYRGAEIVSEIQDTLSRLAANSVQASDGPCISTPEITLTRKIEGAAFAIADPLAVALRVALRDTPVFLAKSFYGAGVFAADAIARAASSLFETGGLLSGNLGGLTLAVYDKFIVAIGYGQTVVIPRSELPTGSDSGVSQAQTTNSALPPSPPSSQPALQEAAPIKINQLAISTTSLQTAIVLQTVAENSPEAENSAPVSWGVSATPPPPNTNSSGGQTATESAQGENLTLVSPADHIVISEVLYDAEGSDAGKEFIELYNPTGENADLSGWSLRYASAGSTSTNPLATLGSKSEDITTIGANGFLLVGFNSYNSANYGGKPADILRTSSLPNGAGDIRLILSSGGGAVDEIFYSSSSIGAAGESVERKAVRNGECAAASGAGEFSGNGCDTNTAADFNIRSIPHPQNSENLPEPRSQPQAPSAPNGEDSMVSFDTSALSLAFAWQPSKDAAGSTSTLLYKIFQVNPSTGSGDNTSSPPAFIAETTSTEFSMDVADYGRDYNFEIQVVDGDGLASATSSASVTVPDWLTTIQGSRDELSQWSFYSDNWYNLGSGFYGTTYAVFLEGKIIGGNFLDILPSELHLQEFLDPNHTSLNQDFLLADGLIFTRDLKKVAIKGLNIPLQPNKYYRLTTLNKLQNASVALSGTSATGFTAPPEYPESPLLCSSVTPSEAGAAMWNSFMLGAGCVAHIYPFSPFLQVVMRPDFPAQSAPSVPQNLAVSFDGFNMLLTVTWASSTDEDTIDKLLRYEFNFSTSTDSTSSPQTGFADDSWQEVDGFSKSVTVEQPNSYLIGVRAKDDLENTSAPATINWSFPGGFVRPTLSASLNSASQSFVLGSSGRLKSIKVFTRNFEFGGPPRELTCSLKLFEVAATTTFELAASGARNESKCEGDLEFTFSSLPEVVAGRTYRWTYGFNSLASSVKFLGYAESNIEGEFGNTSIADAKFEIVGESGILLFN